MLNDKEDCVESIIKTLEKTSAWRKTLIARWPDDSRNVKAARALDNLSREAANLTDGQWCELQKHFGWASESWSTALNNSARSVGFHNRCGDLAVFVRVLLDNLSITTRVAV